MKNSLTNPVKYGKIIAAEAILLTVFIHLLFFVIFSVPEEKYENAESNNTSVSMLRLYADDSSSLQMKDYIYKYAPTHFSSDKGPFSFNSFINTDKRSFVRLNDLSGKDTRIVYDAKNIEYGKLPDMKPAQSVLPRREAGKISSTARKIDYPFAVSDSGLVIPLILSVDEQRMINEFSLDCSIYKFLKTSAGMSMPRLVLLQSCGRAALDRLSIKLLYQEMKKISECADGEIFTVHYRNHDADGGTL